MRAIILAAGRGIRLKESEEAQLPKCLLRFGGMSLLERHLRLLKNVGVDDVVLALGFRHDLVEAEVTRLRRQPRPEIVLNPRFDLGSVLTVHTVADAMTRGGEVLLMDADVLYDARIASALVEGDQPVNRLLIDRRFEAGDEPVKVCIRDGVPVPSTYAAEKAGCGSLVARAVGSKQPCIGFVIVSIAHRQGPIARFARRAIRMVDHAHLSGGQLHAPGALQADTLVVGQRGGNVVRLPSDLVG